MRKLRGPFFFAKVSSSAITTSFQQVHLRRSEAPSELQVIHSERVALERLGTLCSTLEGMECQNSPGAKHRSCPGTKLSADHGFITRAELVASTPDVGFVGSTHFDRATSWIWRVKRTEDQRGICTSGSRSKWSAFDAKLASPNQQVQCPFSSELSCEESRDNIRAIRLLKLVSRPA